jgi:deoxyribonuclease-4
VLNVATTNNRIRIPSRKLLAQHAQAAAAIGAKGLIVHGGHVTGDEDPAVGIDNWRKAFAQAADSGGFGLPILIENTAGGTKAIARHLDRIAQLWDAIGDYGPGFCLDTCHAHAGGEDLEGIVDRVTAITGRIDLVHANGSRDTFDSGADRHTNFGTGFIAPEVIAEIVKSAASDVIVETPAEGQASDITYLRQNS